MGEKKETWDSEGRDERIRPMATMDITSGGSKDSVRDESVAVRGALVRSMRVWAVAVEMIERWSEASGGRCIIKSGGGDKEESAR